MTRKTASTKRPAGKLTRPRKSAAKGAKAVKQALRKKDLVVKPVPAKRNVGREIPPLDVSIFPPESIVVFDKWICLACVSDVFMRHLDLAPRTAHLEIRRYTPTISELWAPATVRPWFANQPSQKYCPYCGAPSKWHARLRVYRFEGGKATDALRRKLFKSLPQAENQFAILEERSTQQHAFFEWLEKISTGLNLDNPVWLREVSRHYLSRKEPKTDWPAQFGQIHSIRRSRRLDTGWEVDSGRLFLAPALFDELLLVQYLISRAHKAGGLTLEGRYTLPELFARLRNAGYLRTMGVHANNPSDALEQLIIYLGGGESAVKFYHIVDRRNFLETVKNIKLLKPPKTRAHQTLSGERRK